MIFKFRFHRAGGHVHVRVFAGEHPDALGLAGHLTFRPDEWEDLKNLVLRGRMPAAVRPIWTEVVDDTGNQPTYDLPLDIPTPGSQTVTAPYLDYERFGPGIPPDYADSAE